MFAVRQINKWASGARSLTINDNFIRNDFKRVSQSGCTTKMFMSTAIVIQNEGGVVTVSLKHRCPRAPPQQSAGERQACVCARVPTNREAKRKQSKTPYNGAGYKSRRFLPTTSIPSPSWPTQRLPRARGAREASPGKARWGRRTCTKWRITSSSRASSSNRPSAATAPTSSGEYVGGRRGVVVYTRLRRAQVTHLMLVKGKTPKRLNALRHPQWCQHWTKTPERRRKRQALRAASPTQCCTSTRYLYVSALVCLRIWVS